MVFYITVLKALAACLITNAHYTGIYPTDLIANGGLIGDVIFFAVSGYCLSNIKMNFPRWYGKRLIRCYLPVILATAVYMLLGAYSLGEHPFLWWYGYPTYYHFIASIVVLYIPFYIIMSIPKLKENLPWVMAAIGAVYLLVYLFFYDRSYYHIDAVREPMIRFLFMESMLLGAYFKQKDAHYRNRFSGWHVVALVASFVLYFVSKFAFSSGGPVLCHLQIINQVWILVLLYFTLRVFSGLDTRLANMPKWVKGVIGYIATLTLEIYVVQYVLIDWIRPLFGFPLNWIVLTASILAAAVVLHYVCKLILWPFEATKRKDKV